MAYLSHILGKHVVDSVGQPVGRIVDLAITVAEPFGGEFPPVTLVLVRAGATHLRLRWEMIADLNAFGRGNACLLDKPRAHLTIGQEKGGEVFLRADVLDKQIIDMSNNRLVRVNDVFLIEDGEQLRVAGVDVSLRGLLRRVRHLEDSIVPVLKRLGIAMHREHIPWNEVEIMRTETGGRIQLKVPTDKLSKLHPTDLASIVHQMTPVERTELFDQLDVETAASALEEMEDEVAAGIIKEMDPDEAADIIEEMDPDEAADVLGEIDSEQEREEILKRMDDPEEAADIKHLLSYEEGTAGALMTTDMVIVRREMTIGSALETVRAEQPSPDTLHYLHVEDDHHRLVGVLSLVEAVLAEPSTPVGAVMRDKLITVEPQTRAEECARLIAKYDLLSLPVIDLHGQLLGIVTVDDILDVILDVVAPDEWRSKLPRIFVASEQMRTPAH
ncbi:MAG TPA: CBS domain-containing protein [Abditibacteriaceae bacterium]|nr:CBS domain-containing protein [Abditibacteriaceae bacterium]